MEEKKFDTELPDYEETPEAEGYSVGNDLECTKAIDRIKALSKILDRYADTMKQRIDDLKAKQEKYTNMMESKIKFYSYHVKEYFESLPEEALRKTKSGSKIYDLPDGKVTLTESTKFTYDKESIDFINFLNASDLPYVKTHESVDWAEFKKILSVEDGMCLIKGSGLIVPETIVKAEKKTEIKIG